MIGFDATMVMGRNWGFPEISLGNKKVFWLSCRSFWGSGYLICFELRLLLLDEIFYSFERCLSKCFCRYTR